MSRQLYSARILEHYKEPHNAGVVDDPDMVFEVSNPHCGDELQFTATVVDGRFDELKFEGDGCALSVAAASMLTDDLTDAPVGEADAVDEDAVFDMLGIQKDDIAPVRMKCVLLARDGITEMVEQHG